MYLLISCSFKLALKNLFNLLESFWEGLSVWEELGFNPLHFPIENTFLEGENSSAVVQKRASLKEFLNHSWQFLPDISLNVP